MSDQTQQNRETMSAVGFAGLLALVFGPLGLVVAASAVAIQKACFPGVGEGTEAAERRQHEASLDRAAARQRRNARHQAYLDQVGKENDAYREAMRAWDGDPTTRPQRYTVDKNLNRKPAGFWRNLAEAWLYTRAQGALATDRARQAYPEAKQELAERQANGEKVLRPSLGALFGAALAAAGLRRKKKKDGDKQGATTSEAADQKPAEGEKPADQSGTAAPADPNGEDPEAKTAPPIGPTEISATGETEPVMGAGGTGLVGPTDPAVASDIDWYATGGQGDTNTQTTGDTAGENSTNEGDTMSNETRPGPPLLPGTSPAGYEPPRSSGGLAAKPAGPGTHSRAQGETNLDTLEAQAKQISGKQQTAVEATDTLGKIAADLRRRARVMRENADASEAPTAARAMADQLDAQATAITKAVVSVTQHNTAAAEALAGFRSGLKPARDADDLLKSSGAGGKIVGRARD